MTEKQCKNVTGRKRKGKQEAEVKSQSESEITEEEKCCVFGKFVPDPVRECVSLIFTKWAQCDRCEHWVHLIYCSSVRVVRRGDSFYCVHC